MKASLTIKCVITIFISLIVCISALDAQQKEEIAIKFQSLTIPSGFDEVRMNAMCKALDFLKWPQTEVRYVVPVIGKSLLSNPELVNRESSSFSYVRFNRSPWGKRNWSWGRVVENKQPLTTELSTDLKEKFLAELSPEQRGNSEFVERYLKRKLDRYQRSQRYRLDGSMDVEVCLAPNSHAAQEYLIATMLESTMPTDALVSMLTSAKKPQNLGTVSFLIESGEGKNISIRFTRDNICINVLADGCFANGALSFAQKIDNIIIDQLPLTYEQLLVRRPSVTVSLKDKMTLSYDTVGINSQKILGVQAFIDGQGVTAKDGQIPLLGKKGRIKVEVIVITRELLANSFEKDLNVDE